jgi:phosphatidylglycerol:prolipoprotein diacylglycerol transferase
MDQPLKTTENIQSSDQIDTEQVNKLNIDQSDSVLETDISSSDLNNLIEEFGSKLKPEGIRYPEIDPILFEAGPLIIRWYSLAYLFGIILGWLYIKYLNKRFYNQPIKDDHIESIPAWMILSIIIGGRIGYVLFYNFEYFSNNLGEIYKVWKGGMSFHGGLIGVIAGLFLFSKVKKISFFKITDLIAAAAPIGLLLGRIANFINAELKGRETEVSWGIIYPDEFIKRHPSQLYEAFLEGLVLFVIIFIAIKFHSALKYRGLASSLFLIGYGSFRFIAEFYRQPDIQIGFLYGTNWLTMGMLLSLPLIALGFAIMIASLLKGLVKVK